MSADAETTTAAGLLRTGARGGLGTRFRWFWLAQTGSVLGDQITLIVLPLLAVATAGASDFQVALVATMLKLPFLVLGLPAGVWVTRWGLARSMAAADGVRATVLVAVLSIVSLHDSLGFAVLLAGAVMIGSASVFFQIAYQSIVPDLVADAADWHRANLRLTLSESVALLAGPALAGAVIAAWSLRSALGVDIATYVVSVVALSLMLRGLRRSRVTSRPTAVAPEHMGALIRTGFRYVRDRSVLNLIMWVGAIFNIGVAMFETMLVLYGVRTLGLGVDRVGLAVAASGLGFPIGGLASGALNRRRGKGRTLALAGVPSVAGIVALGLIPTAHAFVGLAAALLTFGLGQGMFAVNAVTLRQEHSEAGMRPMATAIHRFTSWGALSVGTMLAGVVAELVGLRGVMLVAGAIATTCLVPLFRREVLAAP